MGVAPFFERTRQSVAQVLRGGGAEDLAERLSALVLTIAFDASAEGSPEGQATLDMAVRLAARLYPRIRVLPLHGARRLADALEALARSINPVVELEGAAGDARSLCVIVGGTTCAADVVVHVGSDRWVARVSTRGPIGSGTSGNVLGAGAAACLGMANVFRAAFADRLPRAGLDEDASVSLLNFETGPSCANGDLPVHTDLGLLQLVGVGAVGNAFVWSMARTAGLVGTLHLVDHEAIELSNLQRYVLAALEHDEAVKVMIAAEALKGTGLRAVPFQTSWADYVAGIGHHRFERVAVALDTARDRVQVQGSLPRRIVNAWTQDGDLGVSRHGFDGDEACLACLYLPQGARRSEDEIVAEELRLPWADSMRRVRDMLYGGAPVGDEFVREVAELVGLDVVTLLPFSSLPLRAFRQRAVCGGMIMRAPDGGGAGVEVPMAFQSALAGIMLAAEVVAGSSSLRPKRPGTRTVIDLMRAIPTRPTSWIRKGTSGVALCICQDGDWLTTFRSKYGISTDAEQAEIKDGSVTVACAGVEG